MRALLLTLAIFGADARTPGPRAKDSTSVDARSKQAAELFSAARLIPSYRRGELVGLRIFSIKPGSGWTKCGVKNGDVIVQQRKGGALGPLALTEVLEACLAGRKLKTEPGEGTAVTANDVSVRLIPSFRENKQIGLMVMGVKAGTAPARRGIKNADTVIAIGDEPLPEELPKAMDAVNRALKENAPLTVLRKDKRVEIAPESKP